MLDTGGGACCYNRRHSEPGAGSGTPKWEMSGESAWLFCGVTFAEQDWTVHHQAMMYDARTESQSAEYAVMMWLGSGDESRSSKKWLESQHIRDLGLSTNVATMSAFDLDFSLRKLRSMRTALPCLLIWLLLPGVMFARGTIDYARDVKPLLQKKCHACHGTLWQKSGLRLDVGRLILEGGEGGRVVVPGKSSASELIRRITSKDAGDRMPPEDEGEPLTPAEIALLKSWIDQGAKVPANENIPPSPFDYWSYQQPKRPAVPVGKNTGWERNPVDAFIAAQHEQRGLQPSPPSDKSALLRRVYLDLIGVPPTREELHAFLADPSDQAYEKTVDRLLDDSRHGQRWARHWMDVWRYSDWHGRRKLNNHRNSQRHIWRWRDWIVDSINEDKPYDRMILEMLAGDEIAGDDPDIVRATGYLGRSWYIFNKTVWMQDTVEHLGQAFLGVKFECCRCHDHKYDPVSQREYYRMRAFFRAA